jgi:hypothetical protein
VISLSIIIAIAIITHISIRYRVIINPQPITEASNIDMGILVDDQAPMKMMIFENLLPFFRRIPATGKATYKGPAAKEPNKNAITAPKKPAFSPISRIMVSFGIHVSKRPISMKIGGINISISDRF